MTPLPAANAAIALSSSSLLRPWRLPERGLAVFYGSAESPRLSHYFLPRALAQGQPVLYLDGANRFDPLLVARLARQRGLAAAEFNRRLRVARAFTCFQLTELLARVPRLLGSFAAGALVVTGLPELYFDQDVREREAAESFRRALGELRRCRLPVAVFSGAGGTEAPQRKFLPLLLAQAAQVWRLGEREDGSLTFACERHRPALPR